MKRLMTYTTFFITRNPFQRLVSAHRSKFYIRGANLKRTVGVQLAMEQAKLYLPDGIRYIKTR